MITIIEALELKKTIVRRIKKQVKTLKLVTRITTSDTISDAAKSRLTKYPKKVLTVSILGIKVTTNVVIIAVLLLGTAMTFSVQSSVSAAACPYDANLGSTDPTNKFNVPSAGTYTIWTRMAAANAANNKVNLEIDGNTCFSVGGGSFATTTWLAGSENWIKYSNGSATSVNTMQLAAGDHTFVYKGSQAGVMVDKILVTSDPTCTPTGKADGTDPCPSSGDSTPPTVSITSPTNGQAVTGIVNVSAVASDAGSGVKEVKFLVDGQVIGTDTTSPYTYSWNSATAANGSRQLTAQAIDNANNTATSTPAVSVTVSGGSATKQGDLNGDGRVNITDLSILLTNWNKTGVPASQGDINGSGKVDITDLSILLSKWG